MSPTEWLKCMLTPARCEFVDTTKLSNDTRRLLDEEDEAHFVTWQGAAVERGKTPEQPRLPFELRPL